MKWLFLTLLILFETVADIFAKKYGIKPHWSLAAGAISFYIICNTFWLCSLRNGMLLSIGTSVFAVCTAVLGIAIGLAYGETIITRQCIGIILGIIAIMFIT